MEALSQDLLKESTMTKAGIGFKLGPRLERIPCLLFADDCLLFCKAEITTCRRLKSLLDKFCSRSGQLVNYHKSTLTFSSNATAAHRQLAAGIFNITHSDSLGKYLGCPVFQKRPSRSTFNDLIDKATKKLVGWKAKCLSKAGRTILIQSHLESLPAHTMQCFQIPAGVTNNIDKINRQFFWKRFNTDSGLPLVAWDTICRPKQEGGIGLHKTAALNLAYQAKLAWKILTNHNSLWVRLMRTKYLRQQDFFLIPRKQGDSVVWKSILNCRNLLRQGLMWTIGDGKDILFWQDNWIENRSILEILAVDDPDSLDLNTTVSHFIENKQWNVSKLHSYLRNPALVQKILGLPIPLTDIKDSFCWGLSTSGAFTTKTASWLAHGHVHNDALWPYKGIWKLDIMPKIKIFLWQMCHNALPVRGTLIRRGCQLDPTCPLCANDIESSEHLFQDCPQTRQIWELAHHHHWIPYPTSTSASNAWLPSFLIFLTTYDKKALQHIAFLLWSIWQMRNEVIFQQAIAHPYKCLIRAKNLCAEWRIRTCMSVDISIQGSSSTPSFKHIQLIRWQPPQPGLFKLNFDGSLQGNSAAGGFIIRDWQGEIRALGAEHYGHTSVLLAESRALRDGLETALKAGCSRLIVEGDNALVIAAFNKERAIPWRIKTIMPVSYTHLTLPTNREV